ncbi:hypothetical protein BDV93DRAFT_499788 [Ceratobasidium sp. AG-I]|nr:hypothetical protein BDV93DRAFT_499788 [Ceratobasidium sp. AG-I]
MTPEPDVITPAVVEEGGIEEKIDELSGSGHHSIDEEDKVDQDGLKARKTKRARFDVPKTKTPRKKYVRGKQGGLQGMMKMPLEIFTEIACHITPGELIVLVRCSKFFRTMLLRRSAILIWQRAAQNVPGLPPCPTGMCEPQYAALMFSKHCTLCGVQATAKLDPYLRVRLCSACRDTRLEAWSIGSLHECAYLISRSGASKPKTAGGGHKGRSYRPKYYCLLSEAQELRRKSLELQRSKDQNAYSRWVEERQKSIQVRSKEASLMQEYILSISKSHVEELVDARKQRREMIRERLNALGWTDAEQNFCSRYAKPWNALVESSKPLTDRTWNSLLPKLVPLLEQNRARQLEDEKSQRRIQRRKFLHELLMKMKRTEDPFAVAHTALVPDQESELPFVQNSDSDWESNSDPFAPFFSVGVLKGTQRQRGVVQNPFPLTTKLLDWECLKDLSEMEADVERIEELFNERREQVRQGVENWRMDFEKRLVEIYKAGVDGTMPEDAVGTLEGGETKAEPIVKVEGDDSTEGLSPHVRFLLRADTIFKEDTSESIQYDEDLSYIGEHIAAIPSPCYYPNIISQYDSFHGFPEWPSSLEPEVDVEKYIRYTEAEKLVKKMLVDIQMPDATHMGLEAMKSRFACGRCTELKPMTWDNLVLHYMQQQQQWGKDLIKTGLYTIRHPIAFRNVHNVDWTTNPKPLARILTVEEASNMNFISRFGLDRFRCMLCDGTGRHHLDLVEGVRAHLQDVHNIADPTEGLYYRSEQDYDLVSSFFSDEWQKQWDAFHDEQAASAEPTTAFSSNTDL